jgi:hypothetical protein
MFTPNTPNILNLYIHDNSKYIKYVLCDFSISEDIDETYNIYNGNGNVYQHKQPYSTFDITLNVIDTTDNIYDEISEYQNIIIEVNSSIYIINNVQLNPWSIRYDSKINSDLKLELRSQLVNIIDFDQLPIDYMFMFKKKLRKKKLNRIIY